MENLGIVDLYEGTGNKKTEQFMGQINSNVRIQIDTNKVIKDIDWIEKMEETIPYIDNIFRNPNRFIINEEEIVKIELARKITVDSIKHLSKNTNLIQDINKKTGDVRPSKILNINKEESYDTYENRFIYSLVQNMKFFIERRKKTLENIENNQTKDNKQIDYTGTSKMSGEKIDVNITLNTSLDAEKQESNQEQKNLIERITEIEKKVMDLTSSEVYKLIDKKHITLVRSPIKKTNMILKNVNFQYAVKLWNFLQENFEDKTKNEKDKKDYIDNSEFKQLMDESFMLQYLIVKTLDEDKVENEETNREINENIMDKMIDKMIDIDNSLTEDQIIEMIANKYEVIKYKKMVTLQEIQKIFKKHIDKYIEQIS